MRNYFAFIFSAFCMSAFSASGQTRHYTSTEDTVISMIAALPEVKKLPRKFKDTSKHFDIMIKSVPYVGRDISGETLAHPDKSYNYYLVCAGYRFSDDNQDFLDVYTFALDVETHQINYQDIVTEKLIPLAEWRAKNRRMKNKRSR